MLRSIEKLACLSREREFYSQTVYQPCMYKVPFHVIIASNRGKKKTRLIKQESFGSGRKSIVETFGGKNTEGLLTRLAEY